ncbi:calcineurin-binding protein [Ephemerocybe angulata]|uniref:Calcineurin-binding protein n=1 Tax=Ephemerocybe angulata TaxID=980116 RepID=A0A8H6MFU7_9AGAR|nr:calcineurin-binding protein [Tulosesus angulatus]
MAVELSLPSPPSPPRSPLTEATNTVAVTGLPRSFFDPIILSLLRDHFASYGTINQWVPLPGFGRVIVVFELDSCAETAKLHCDPINLHATQEHPEVTLRVFRADPNPLVAKDMANVVPESSYLAPPPIEKNFLISPPGSPPVGWEQILEDPPNSTPLADDLMHALQKLKVQEEEDERGSFAMLLHPDEAGVGVYVEDCDAGISNDMHEDNWVYGETMPARDKWRPIATAMPPLQAMIST